MQTDVGYTGERSPTSRLRKTPPKSKPERIGSSPAKVAYFGHPFDIRLPDKASIYPAASGSGKPRGPRRIGRRESPSVLAIVGPAALIRRERLKRGAGAWVSKAKRFGAEGGILSRHYDSRDIVLIFPIFSGVCPASVLHIESHCSRGQERCRLTLVATLSRGRELRQYQRLI